MKVYLIAKDGAVGSIISELQNYGEVVVLNSGNKDINSYTQLFEDSDEKILGIDPGILEWNFPKESLKNIKNLKGICTKSSWGFYIDTKYCNEKGIPVTNVPGANSLSVAEYAFWMMMSLVKQLPSQIKEGYKTTLDKEHEQIEISGKTVGIIGLGKIGGYLAKMGQAFGMNVLYWSRSQKDVSYKFASIEELLKTSNFVFDCLENCKETQGFLNKDNLSLMEPTSYFVSVMGGAGWGVEDDNYLVEMVENGKLAGFAVENEHKGEFPKEFKGNIFIPTAYAWYTKEARVRMLEGFRESLIGLVKGQIINQIGV